ncbi:hypothetical protein GCM10010336_75150 [Streptomyces goshikiensis]|nr:hypothetical protein GCM10010336_75150 [Streptomyces goshikiensis]
MLGCTSRDEEAVMSIPTTGYVSVRAENPDPAAYTAVRTVTTSTFTEVFGVDVAS